MVALWDTCASLWPKHWKKQLLKERINWLMAPEGCSPSLKRHGGVAESMAAGIQVLANWETGSGVATKGISDLFLPARYHLLDAFEIVSQVEYQDLKQWGYVGVEGGEHFRFKASQWSTGCLQLAVNLPISGLPAYACLYSTHIYACQLLYLRPGVSTWSRPS